MAFGFGFGDIAKGIELAWKIYDKGFCTDNRGKYRRAFSPRSARAFLGFLWGQVGLSDSSVCKL